jgi:hypothetical protein
MELVDRIAEAVLYEGYLLYPYRRSAMKNQQRWQFGGIYPERYSQVTGGSDRWTMQTQCLVNGDDSTMVEVRLRFLQVVDRRVAEMAEGALRPVDILRVGGQTHREWEEAIERTTVVTGPNGRPAMCLGDLFAQGRSQPIDIAAANTEEQLLEPDGTVRGALVREWQDVRGMIEVSAEPVIHDVDEHAGATRLYRLTVLIRNTTPWAWPPAEAKPGSRGASKMLTLPQGGLVETRPRKAPIRNAFISTHTILRVHGGEFISLLEPPPLYAPAVESCLNSGTWPVLVGKPGEHHTILSSPIILYDYPEVAPESSVSYFDATEIDELLALSVMTLSDDEKQEMRETDPRAREILQRTEALTAEQLAGLHGAVRGWQVLRREDP